MPVTDPSLKAAFDYLDDPYFTITSTLGTLQFTFSREKSDYGDYTDVNIRDLATDTDVRDMICDDDDDAWGTLTYWDDSETEWATDDDEETESA